MFGWLRDLWPAKRRGEYSERERAIFRYWNGAKWINADPMMVWKRLAAKGADIDAAAIGADSQWKGNMKCHDDLVRYIRDIFELKTPTSLDVTDTLSEPECVDLLNDYYTYSGMAKKKENPTPTSATETSPTTAPTSDAAPPTPSILVSGSTDSAPPIAPVTSPIAESSLPLA